MSKLLSNLPIENLTPENDYLGIIEKGDMIKNFLLQNTEEFSNIKMFALYGEWGSGKSTLMKYLQKTLEGPCNTFFFEAWEFESDNNLSFSLLEDLMDKSLSASNKVSKEILEIAEDLFVGFTKSIRISIPGVSVSGKELIESLEKEKPLTFLQLKKKFKEEFKKWENLVIKDDTSKFNIVFIDDLDRCEPENVLNLLSALKLFFTYGKKTIFLCGVDKKAVYEAIRTKYSDVVKSEEYLEKVFDISFRMPENISLSLLVSQYFSNDKAILFGGAERGIDSIITQFFISLRFKNPRRLKKVLNKYFLFTSIVNSLPANHQYRSLAPKIFENDIVLFDLIFCLYFIITKEFHPQIFNEVSEENSRMINYAEAIKNTPQSPSATDVRRGIDSIDKLLSKGGFDYSHDILKKMKSMNSQSKMLMKAQVAINFSPVTLGYLESGCFYGPLEFINGFKSIEKGMDYRFTHYLLGNIEDLVRKEESSSVGISDIYNLVNIIL